MSEVQNIRLHFLGTLHRRFSYLRSGQKSQIFEINKINLAEWLEKLNGLAGVW